MSKKEKNENMNKEEVENVVNGEENIVESTENHDAQENQSTENSKKESTDNIKSEEKKNKKKDPKDTLIEELQDKNKRQMAEFDNFRKRTEKEKSAMYEIGAKDIIDKMLPIIDNFERGFKAITEDEKVTPFADGMDKVFKQLVKALEDTGVKAIEAVGTEFNPEMHNAVMHVEDDSVGENIIVEEFEKGYTYRDTVVRHSMVKVAN